MKRLVIALTTAALMLPTLAVASNSSGSGQSNSTHAANASARAACQNQIKQRQNAEKASGRYAKQVIKTHMPSAMKLAQHVCLGNILNAHMGLNLGFLSPGHWLHYLENKACNTSRQAVLSNIQKANSSMFGQGSNVGIDTYGGGTTLHGVPVNGTSFYQAKRSYNQVKNYYNTGKNYYGKAKSGASKLYGSPRSGTGSSNNTGSSSNSGNVVNFRQMFK